MGAVTEFAILPVALAIAAYASRTHQRLVRLLQSNALAGLLASLYGIAQYFGWDPFLPAAQYHVGEGIYQIVRPPGTLGHSDYFAAFLLWPVFAGIALFTPPSWAPLRRRLRDHQHHRDPPKRFPRSRPSPSRRPLRADRPLAVPVCAPSAAALAGAAIVFAAFYISPAGQHLRARVHWIGEDPAGGARLLLWRDSLKMAAAKPIAGFGPDNFVAEFPHYQSQELERAYPDFYNESPHNLFLDVLTSEGALGLLSLTASPSSPPHSQTERVSAPVERAQL